MIIGYLRVSTGKQHPANQQDEIKRFASSRNWTIDTWVTEVVSGKKRGQDRKLGSLAMRISLLIGDREQARQLCLSGIGEGPSDPVFSILKSTLFDCTPKMEYIEAASAQLLAKGEVQHALDLWMILDDWNTAIEKLVKLDDFKKSVTILSALKQDEDSITQTVARKFIAHRSTGIGLRLLGRAKSFSDIVNIFENLGEAEQAGFLKTCSQLDPHL